MILLVAGAHGTTGQQLTRKLVARGHQVRAMIRDERQADAVRALGAEPVIADLTGNVAFTAEGADAVYFVAGSKGQDLEAVDKHGAIKLIDAAVAHGARRFLMLSSISADDPDAGPEELQPYLRAKHAADEHLRRSGLAYTIVQPGRLTDDDAQGTITAAERIGHRDGAIARADVAEAMAVALTLDHTHGRTIELLGGDVPIEAALQRV